jgi:NADH-quinone oxidoreductase subunit A
MHFDNYFGLAVILGISVAIGLLLPLLSRLLGPYKPKAVNKQLVYESGMDPVGSARERFAVKFYLVAMLFIIFDIEVIFLYPWAVNYKELVREFGLFPFWEMLVFAVILFVGYIYLRKKEAFKWDE